MAEELAAKLDELKPALSETLTRESNAQLVQGKTFDFAAWVAGKPIDQKYPGGPVYPPLQGTPTLLSCSAGISPTDWAYTAFASSILYMWGYRYNQPVFRFTGHRLGLLAAAPMLLLGYTNGLHRAYLRHTGMLPNGHESLYPGYREDATPYHVKHKISDRYVTLPPIPEPVLHISDEDRAALNAAITSQK